MYNSKDIGLKQTLISEILGLQNMDMYTLEDGNCFHQIFRLFQLNLFLSGKLSIKDFFNLKESFHIYCYIKLICSFQERFWNVTKYSDFIRICQTGATWPHSHQNSWINLLFWPSRCQLLQVNLKCNLSSKAIGCRWVCLFTDSSKTVNPNEP